MSYCKNCGTELVEGDAFCRVCGEKVNNNDPSILTDSVVRDYEQKPFKRKKYNTKAVVGGIVAVLVIAVVILALIFGIRYKDYINTINNENINTVSDSSTEVSNKYNNQGYVDVSGRTVEEVAEEEGMSLDEFLAQYNLPADMPGDTTESAAYNNIPFSKMAETYDMGTEELKELFQLPDKVTGDTPWGEALDQATLGAYVGVDELEEFKEYYGLSDEVTANTLWGDVRKTVEEKQREERIASENTSN